MNHTMRTRSALQRAAEDGLRRAARRRQIEGLFLLGVGLLGAVLLTLFTTEVVPAVFERIASALEGA
jgi:hypothetical protein